MTLRQLMRYDDLYVEVQAQDNLNLDTVLMQPLISPQARLRQRLEWMREAHVTPQANRIKKQDVKQFLSHTYKKG